MSTSEAQLKSNVKRAPDVFSYLDFREYLRAYIEFRKSNRSSGLTISGFARFAKISRPLLIAVLDGSRKLHGDRIGSIAEACHLTEWEALYFSTLVHWNQADDSKVKAAWWDKLSGLRPKANYHTLSQEEGHIVGRWYFLTLLELVRFSDFQWNEEWISEKLKGSVSSVEIKETLELLLKLGMVVKTENGIQLNHEVIVGDLKGATTEDIRKYHETVNKLGVTAMASVPREKREMAALCLGIQAEHLETVKEKVRKFQLEMMDYVQSFETVDSVYQLNLQLFPIVDKDGDKE